MRCGKQEHQPGQKCPAKNAKCKSCHKIGHFHCVCQSKKRAKQRANLVQTQENDDDTHIDENGVRQPNPPRANKPIHQGQICLRQLTILMPIGESSMRGST